MTDFVVALACRAGMPEDKGRFLAGLLVDNDLRGVFSHGSRQIATYARLMRDGKLNPDPHVRLVRDDDATLLVDGDGGLGYFASYRAAEEVVSRAKRYGIASAVTRHHGHFGAAGIYSRILASAGLIAYVTSGHQLELAPGRSILEAPGGSPMSFAVPAGDAPAMVLDFGAMHDLYPGSPHVPGLMANTPGLVFRSLGLGYMCQALGGFLAGVPLEEERAVKSHPGANQGSLLVAIDVSRFLPPEQFEREVRAYSEMVTQMEPLPGQSRSLVPGALEAEREKEWRNSGIPVGDEHKRTLAEAAREFGLSLPF